MVHELEDIVEPSPLFRLAIFPRVISKTAWTELLDTPVVNPDTFSPHWEQLGDWRVEFHFHCESAVSRWVAVRIGVRINILSDVSNCLAELFKPCQDFVFLNGPVAPFYLHPADVLIGIFVRAIHLIRVVRPDPLNLALQDVRFFVSVDFVGAMVFEVFDWPEVINVDLLFEFILYYRIVAEGKVETVNRIWVLL